MPQTFLGFVRRTSMWDQIWLTAISVGVSFLGTVPIEIQRRMVNDTIKETSLHPIAMLALIYAALIFAEGLLKLLMNMYRSWVSTNCTRVLRTTISALASDNVWNKDPATSQGVTISMIVAESDAVGGFVGECIAEPVLEGAILVMMFSYMVFLQPGMAMLSLLILATQVAFVPVMQRAINRLVQRRIAKLREAGADVIAHGAAENARQEQRFGEVFQIDMGVFALKFSLNFFMNLTTHLRTIAILTLGAWLVVRGETEIGTIVAFLSALASINDPWNQIVSWFQNIMVTDAKYQLVRDGAARLAGISEFASH